MLAHDEGQKLSDAARLSLQRIRTTTAGMTELVDRMLELSRVNRSELKTEDFDLRVLASGIVDELRSAEREHDVELRLPPSLPVRGDMTLVRMALSNLLENAWKFTRGRPSPRIELGAELRPNGERSEAPVCSRGARRAQSSVPSA